MSSSTSCASFLRSNNMHPMDMCGRSTCSKSYLILSHSGLVKAACVCGSLFSVDPFWLTRSWHFLTLNDDAASLILSFGDLIGITLVQTNRFPSKQDSSPKHISLFFISLLLLLLLLFIVGYFPLPRVRFCIHWCVFSGVEHQSPEVQRQRNRELGWWKHRLQGRQW